MRLPPNRPGAWKGPSPAPPPAPKRHGRGNTTWLGPCYFNAEAILTKLANADALAIPTVQLSPSPTRAFHLRSLESAGECVLFVGEASK